MKKIIYVLIAGIMAFALAACGSGGSSENEGAQENTQGSSAGGNSLVVYFSATGNTESVAETLAQMQGAELYEIVPEDPYTDEDLDYNDSSSRTTTEQNDETARPAISGEIDNIENYDTVYVGFPIWWNDMPRIMYTFFDTYDFSGKTLIPFATSGGSGIERAEKSLQDHCPDAVWGKGQLLNGGNAAEWVRRVLTEN